MSTISGDKSRLGAGRLRRPVEAMYGTNGIGHQERAAFLVIQLHSLHDELGHLEQGNPMVLDDRDN
ncbi:hypothetical protein PCANC_26141 [Puccinia coronata f. sp. avenae]|uniref:Uncharacterized protein n=1 Tax=Puccinia coronata f. sp. avenae TaxID=200324 RepID=A0A2N5RY18_9BASI|nr:hypothetical protein PCANC_26141 [Puccinia coronata f. sp. avenae]